MPADVVLPNLGFGMNEGRVLAWRKNVGDPVRKGEPIADIESDKATVELDATVDGTLDAILVPADKVATVGAVLARIRTGEAPRPAATPRSEPSSVSPVAQRMAHEHGIELNQIQGTGPGGRIVREDVQAFIDRGINQNRHHLKTQAAPAVRRLARDRSLDLTSIRGTGRDGRVTRSDVEAALRTSPVASEEHAAEVPGMMAEGRREVPLSQVRRSIARRLAQSVQEAPHFYVTAELDLSRAIKALPAAVGINALLLYLTVQTLKDQPDLNATFEDGHLYQYSYVSLAVAVAVEQGLISPVLHHADDYSLSGLAARSRDLIERTRAGRLRPQELGGGTFTVSNLGVVPQVERFSAILNPPQVAILAVGAAKERPVVIDSGLHIRKTVHLTLSADHRIVDGLVAARFLETFDRHLQAFAS